MHDILEPPISMQPFQAELDAAVKDYPGIRLRLEWAPRLIEARVIDHAGNRRVYRKYPVLGMRTQVYRVGTSYRRNGKIVAYHKTDELIPPNVRLTDLAVAHLERVHHSIHIFVIEKQLPNDYARQEWERKRTMSRAAIGQDIFGPFPHKGVWVWFDDISAHYNGCCEMAEQRGLPHCVGLYREPDATDLERVRASLKEWAERERRADLNPLIEQSARDWVAAHENEESAEMVTMFQELRECEALDKMAQERTRVIGGTSRPLHSTRY